ncbi:MAG: hypothetical protein ACOH10_13720 [Rhodoglobus sp.]
MAPTDNIGIRRNTNAETVGQPRPESLARDTGRLLAACGIERSRSWTSRTVRDYVSSAIDYPFGAYLLNRVQLNAEQRRIVRADNELAYLLEYADPTGETAVRNVTRGGVR